MSILTIGKLDSMTVESHARDMLSYVGTRRRHVDYATVSSAACRMPR
jgi:hypothetical protein